MQIDTDFRLLVVIVNYRTAELVCQMLTELTEQLDPRQDRVIIVDNCSADSSYDQIRTFLKTHDITNIIELVSSERNGGFSYGNNFGIKEAENIFGTSPQYVILLNPDTFVKNNAIPRLLEFMNSNPRAGIAGSALMDEYGKMHCSAFKFHSLISEMLSGLSIGYLDRKLNHYLVADGKNIPRTNKKTDWVAGACMIIRYDVIQQVGWMDENYFLYFEETDFCLQASKFGWECWYVPSSIVLHYEGKSTGVVSTDSKRLRRPKYWFESRKYYFLKNYGILYTIFADIIWGTCYAIYRTRSFIQRKQVVQPEHMFVDFWKNSIIFSWLFK